MNRSTYQRKQAHRRRLALGRAMHQLAAMRRSWFRAWHMYGRGKGPKPGRIPLPRILRKHRRPLYRFMVRGA